jgi:hypothetical protein
MGDGTVVMILDIHELFNKLELNAWKTKSQF